MFPQDKRTNIGTISMVVVAIAVLAGMFAYRYTRPESAIGDVRTWTSLSVCTDSTDSNCDPGTMTLDYTLITRREFWVVAHGFPHDEALDVVLQDVTIEFLSPLDETQTPGDEIFIYLDSNEDGRFDAESDDQLASATLKGRRIKFENLNLRFSEDEIPQAGLTMDTKLFVAGRDVEHLVTSNPVDGISVRAQNLLAGRRDVLDVATFADTSMYATSEAMVQSRREFLSSHPEFQAGDTANEVVLPSDQYRFEETVILPIGLAATIEPGTIIELDPGISFVSYSPVQMAGTTAAPIAIRSTSASEPFGTFAMIGGLGNTDVVTISSVDIRGGSEATINGAYLSGMFSVYRFGETHISDSVFEDAYADDALNVKYSNVVVSGNRFNNNAADAIDGDFITGVLELNSFAGNGNDSLDFSGSDVTVRHNRVSSSGDKCVSVGEGTTILVTHNVFEQCEIGVEIKDASVATVTENLITDARTWAVNAYVKKFFWGKPTFTVTDNILLGNTGLFGELAATTSASSNIVAGVVSELEQEHGWLAETLSTAPSR